MVGPAYLLTVAVCIVFSTTSYTATTINSISIESERATYQRHTTPSPHVICIHKGNVRTELSNGVRASADTLEALIQEGGGGQKHNLSTTIERITLKNHVTITYHDQTITGDEALLTIGPLTLSVTGNITITKKD